jgi:ATP-dependent Clp protease adaptor protein ClpS
MLSTSHFYTSHFYTSHSHLLMTMAIPGGASVELPMLDQDTVVALVPKVILFNDEWHTFEEVINQIIKATQCSLEKAEQLTWEVHDSGKAMVFEGEMSDCLRVSSVLEEIKLHTQIEC